MCLSDALLFNDCTNYSYHHLLNLLYDHSRKKTHNSLTSSLWRRKHFIPLFHTLHHAGTTRCSLILAACYRDGAKLLSSDCHFDFNFVILPSTQILPTMQLDWYYTYFAVISFSSILQCAALGGIRREHSDCGQAAAIEMSEMRHFVWLSNKALQKMPSLRIEIWSSLLLDRQLRRQTQPSAFFHFPLPPNMQQPA